MFNAGSPVTSTRARRLAGAAIALLGLSVAVVAFWWFVLSPPEERSARADVHALGAAVADFVVEEGRLPRVSVMPGFSDGGDIIWGPDFVVESRTMPRADPSRATLFFLVGDVDRWCIEAEYVPPSLFSDSSGRWVHADGSRGEVGRTVDGRCDNDLALVLAAVAAADVPDPGSVIAAALAPLGTCIAYPFSYEVRPATVEVIACDAGHFGEIFHVGEVTGDSFAAYEETAANSCADALMPFVGVPRSISALNAEPFTVDQAGWDAGARQFSCFLFLPTEDYLLVGSARNSWR